MGVSGVIIVDKPADWTSHDVVAKLRGVFHEKRIGHGGTLDPMATGVLPVFVGRATRAVEYCENARKEYIAVMRPGIVTDTQDTTGTVLESRPADCTAETIRGILPSFTGVQQQLPPMYSAVKVGGKKLYELARKGIETERKPREITVYALELLNALDGEYTLRIECSKGTYIRTLIHDMGQRLGCGAAMSGLRRVRAGAFDLSCVHSLEEIQSAADAGTLEVLMTPVDRLFSDLPRSIADTAQEEKLRCGTAYPCSEPEGRYRVYGEDGSFLMLGVSRNGFMETEKSFFPVRS